MFRTACRVFRFEVEREAAELVKAGALPWEAYSRAVRAVQQRRKDEAAKYTEHERETVLRS